MSDRSTGYRPVHMPFFVSDGNGGLRMDSAGSQANVNLQNLILERAGPIPVPEHIEHVDRQKVLDKFLQDSGDEFQYYRPRPGVAYPLPRLASPQRLHLDFRNRPQKEIAADRSTQLSQLSGTLVGRALEKNMYPDFDKVLKECHGREDEIISLKKANQGMFDKLKNKEMRFAQEDKNWIYEPLHIAIEGTNRVMAKKDWPMRFVFRETWKTERSREIDLWVIYANDSVAAMKGPASWMGSRDIIDAQAQRH